MIKTKLFLKLKKSWTEFLVYFKMDIFSIHCMQTLQISSAKYFFWKYIKVASIQCKKVSGGELLQGPVSKITLKFSEVCFKNAFRSIHGRYYNVKKGALQNFAKFTGKHLCQGLFLNKVKEFVIQVLSCEFCEFFNKSTFFYGPALVAVSCTFLQSFLA